MRLFLAILLAGFGLSAPAFGQAKPDESADLFKPVGPVPKFKITVDEANLKLLQKEPRKYVRSTVRVGEQNFTDVAIHLKGAAGSYRDWNDRPALTLNFDKLHPNQQYRGLDKLHLNNSAQDGSYFHEILAAELALAMGLPAARGTHVLVELNGRKVGLYLLKEGFDKTFLKRHFADPTGNLYDGGFLTDINGDLKLDTGPGKNDRADLKALAKACNEGDANKRYDAVSKLVDIDKFITNAALQILSTDWDGYIRKPNNYRVYFQPKDGKATFIPHGMDQLWQNPGEGLWHGWGGMVARAILDHPEGKKLVAAKLKIMLEQFFTVDRLNKRIDELMPRARDAIATFDKGWANNFENESKNLKNRLKDRIDYVKRELPNLK